MTHASLCSGIGGFDLAARTAGIENVFNCEIDPFCRRVLLKNFPDAIQYENLITTCFRLWKRKVNILSAGFPCQPYSVAGKQLAATDDRAIWPHVLRVIREIKPPYVLLENVTGIIRLALDEVLSSLEAEGYTCETFIVPACSVGAPHRRDRVWIVAYSQHDGFKRWKSDRRNIKEWKKKTNTTLPLGQERSTSNASLCAWNDQQTTEPCQHNQPQQQTGGCDCVSDATNAYCKGLEIRKCKRKNTQQKQSSVIRSDWRLTESPVCSTNDGVSSRLVRNRAAQIKAYGNAIVPKVAYQFFQAIKEYDSNL